jgi:hypothetical protein
VTEKRSLREKAPVGYGAFSFITLDYREHQAVNPQIIHRETGYILERYPLQRGTQMRTQGDFADSFWVQTAALLVVVAVLLEVAARHIW